MELINAIPKFELIFWACAAIFSLIFIIQLLSAFFIGDHSCDTPDIDSGAADGIGHHSADFDSSFPIFTVRNFVIFLTVFGWSGLAFAHLGFSKYLTVICAVILGGIMMLIVAYIFYSMSRLQESGTLIIKNAKGATGKVYITIPAQRTGTGQVQITLQSAIREFDALTDEPENLQTGAMIQVIDVINNNVLVVKKYQG